MVRNTGNYWGLALPAVNDDEAKVPLSVRVGYAWKALTGQIRTVGNIDVSHVKSEGFMEGRLRVYLTEAEKAKYVLNDIWVDR